MDEHLTHSEIWAECERLRVLNESFISARAAAAEVLGRVANKMEPCRCELLAAKQECERT